MLNQAHLIGKIDYENPVKENIYKVKLVDGNEVNCLINRKNKVELDTVYLKGKLINNNDEMIFDIESVVKPKEGMQNMLSEVIMVGKVKRMIEKENGDKVVELSLKNNDIEESFDVNVPFFNKQKFGNILKVGDIAGIRASVITKNDRLEIITNKLTTISDRSKDEPELEDTKQEDIEMEK